MNYECSTQHTSLLQRKIVTGTFLLFLTFPNLTFAMSPSPSLDDHPVKVKLGEVMKVSDLTPGFTLKLASSTLSVVYTGSTTVFLGTGEQTTFDNIEKG